MADLFINPWFKLCLLLAIPQIFKHVGRFIHHVVDQRVRGTNNSVSIAAGPWIEQIIQTGPHKAAIQVEHEHGLISGIDAYWPARKVLILRPETYQSTGSAAYNIAAHEYGHGMTYLSSPFIGHILNWGRTIHGLSGLFVTAFALAAILNVELTTGWFGHLLFGIILFCGGCVLVDEALASLNARRVLTRQSPHHPSNLHLFTAWGAYAFYVLGRAIQWVTLPALLGSQTLQFTPSSLPFSFNATLFVGVLSAILLKRSITVAWRTWKPDIPRTRSGQQITLQRDAIGAFAGGIGALLFAFFTAHEASTFLGSIFIFFCLIPAASPLVALGESLVTWPFLRAIQWTSRVQNESEEKAGNAPITRIPLSSNSASYSRVFAFFQLTYLPLVIFWWYQTIIAFTL